ncbi:MAG: hypothetical protein WD851_25395 [Pirellulales bacterium]
MEVALDTVQATSFTSRPRWSNLDAVGSLPQPDCQVPTLEA